MPTNLENGYYIASILAGMASIISGIFSWRKALRAKSSADEAKIFAEKVKDLLKTDETYLKHQNFTMQQNSSISNFIIILG